MAGREGVGCGASSPNSPLSLYQVGVICCPLRPPSSVHEVPFTQEQLCQIR